MSTARKKLWTAVVCQGGGALGAYEYGAIRELYEARGPDFKPDVITGISVGAVNAAILAGAGIDALDEAWRKRFALFERVPHSSSQMLSLLPPTYSVFIPPMVRQYVGAVETTLAPVLERVLPEQAQQYVSVLGNESMYRLRDEYFYMGPAAALVTNSTSDTTPLRETLEEVLDMERLNNGGSRVVVTAVNIATGEVANFGNTLSLRESATEDGKSPFANKDGMSIEHIMASGSIPPGFPPTYIDGSYYWDGGLRVSTPLSEAINCLERCAPDDPDAEREVIVVELIPMEGKVPTSMQEVVQRFLSIIFSSKLKLDEKLFTKNSKFIDLAGDIDLLLQAIESDPKLKQQVDDALKATSRADKGVAKGVTVDHIHHHEGYAELKSHKKIDAFTMIHFTADHEWANATDFSREAIDARIEAGRREARKQNVREPHYVRIPQG